jgi:FKBP-type peptidyl-prolyl cis-trans isomerase SlpA
MIPRTVALGDLLTFHYRLNGPNGALLVDTFDQQPATLTLGNGDFTPGLEARLLGLSEGQRVRFDLAPDEAFGPRNPELLQSVSRRLLAEHGNPTEEYSVGDVVQFPRPDGTGHYAGRVAELGQDSLLFDFNHPFAGVPLVFEVQLIGVI